MKRLIDAKQNLFSKFETKQRLKVYNSSLIKQTVTQMKTKYLTPFSLFFPFFCAFHSSFHSFHNYVATD